LDKGDGVTEETALTLAQADMRLSKDGGAFAQKSAAGNATHDSDGWYSTTLSTTDTGTVGILKLNVHQPANMLPVWETFYVVEEAVYDAIYGASAAGPLQSTVAGRTLDVDANDRVDVGSWLGTAVTVSAGTAKPEVDAFSISDAAVTADRLEAWMNGAVTASAEGTPSATVIQTDLSEVSDDHFNHMVVVMTGGNLLGQARRISDYAGATGTLTVQPPFTEAPSAADTLMVLPLVVGGLDANGRSDIGSWLGNTITGDGDWAQLQSDATAILADTNELQTDDIPTVIAALNDVSTTEVLTQVNAALDTAIAELGIGAPTATPTIRTGLMLLYMALRNKRDTTSDTDEIHNDAGTVITKATVSDDTAVFSKTGYGAP
jgi:hypothetical protein